jgi:hypothetical protein
VVIGARRATTYTTCTTLDAARKGSVSTPGRSITRNTGRNRSPPVTYRPHAAIIRSELVLMSRFHAACRTAEPSARTVAAAKTGGQS